MGNEIITAAFVVVVIGGLGSFWGVVVAALLVGLVRGSPSHVLPAGLRGVDLSADAAGAAVAAARPVRRAHPAVRVRRHALRAAPARRCRRRWRAGVCPVALAAPIGLTMTSATEVVIFAIAGMALNMLVGHTGLALLRAWRVVRPGRLCRRRCRSATCCPASSCCRWSSASRSSPRRRLVFGFLILRRRGVYFSLLTLALGRACSTAVAFRWTEVTGGENGLGGISGPSLARRRPRQSAGLLRAGGADRLRRRLGAVAVPSLAVRQRAASRSARTSSARASRLSDRPLQARSPSSLSATLDRPRRLRCSRSTIA